jgi:2-hydroxy-6-oxonona-2,4-dienedioate hydrolase
MKTELFKRTTRAMLTVLTILLCCFGLVQGQDLSARSSGAQTLALSRATQATPQNSSALVEKDVTVFGTRIHYIEAGAGPTVILLHGLGGNGQNWALNIAPLAAKFHVIALDQIGFGKSDKPLITYRIGTYVDFLEQFREQLNIERASLVGVSMGGWISAAYTIAFPERIERLVLVDSAGYAPPPKSDTRTLYGLNPSTREGMKQIAAKIFYNKLFTTDAVVDQALTHRLTAGDGYTINSLIESIIRGEEFLDNRVQAIKQPTLIVWGREDGLVLLAEGKRFKKEISNSTLLVFDQCGHVPNVEKPAEFNAAVLKFLTATSPNSSTR